MDSLIKLFLQRHTNLQFPKGMTYEEKRKIIIEDALIYGCPLSRKGVLCREYTAIKQPQSIYMCLNCKHFSDCGRRLMDWSIFRREIIEKVATIE